MIRLIFGLDFFAGPLELDRLLYEPRGLFALVCDVLDGRELEKATLAGIPTVALFCLATKFTDYRTEKGMTESITFYTNPQSRGRIARWMLEEVGADYEAKVLEYNTSMKSDEYLAINPMGKVPTIVHGDQIVTEVAAICAYLADVFPEAGLAPDPAHRGAYYRWLFFAAGPVESAITNQSAGFEVPNEMRGRFGYGCYDDAIDGLAFAVSQHDYIAGNSFSAADVYVGSQIGFGLQFGTVEERPEFLEYWARLEDRRAYQKAAELDNALLGAR